MLDFFERLFEQDSLSPHGICLLWRPELIWAHAVSDALIGLSYVSISVTLAYLLSRRRDIKFGWVVWCFATFILACGATHFFAIYTLWVPDYGAEAVIKVVTAAASVATAVLLWPLLPAALAWPSPERLARSNAALARSLTERDVALADLQTEVAERAQLEAMLRQAQKMEAIGQLTGGLAHDYNNILAIITMNLARIERRLGSDASPEVARSINHALQAAERGAGITEHLLGFSRQSSADQALTDIKGTIDAMAPLLVDGIGPDRRLVLDLHADLPAVNLDANQFENAIFNLVFNARDATPEGGTIRIAARRDEATGRPVVAVAVSDTGEGMPADVIERAFDPFFTTKAVGKGSGLGLSQVFGFTRRLGGSVSITSEVGAGTSVCMQLPAGAAA